MVLFADNKYRYSLQWDAFSEEQIRAGQLMERLGNHKSKVVVPALIEYMERHPEVMLPDFSYPHTGRSAADSFRQRNTSG